MGLPPKFLRNGKFSSLNLPLSPVLPRVCCGILRLPLEKSGKLRPCKKSGHVGLTKQGISNMAWGACLKQMPGTRRKFSHLFGQLFGRTFGRLFGQLFSRTFGRFFGHLFGRTFGQTFGRTFKRTGGKMFGRIYIVGNLGSPITLSLWG